MSDNRIHSWLQAIAAQLMDRLREYLSFQIITLIFAFFSTD
jgi:hypothetical protein